MPRLPCPLALLMVLICVNTHADDDHPDMLRSVIHGDIRGLDPGVTRDGDTDTIHHHIYESLVAYDENLVIRPMLADHFKISPDGKRYTFTLRNNVLFHNGESLTADIVTWNWQRMLDPATGWRCRSWYNGTNPQGVHVTAIRAPDAHTVVFELQQPSSVFLDRMANVQCFTAILHPDSIAGDGTFQLPIGTGPYRLSEWRRGEFIELKKHPAYAARPEPMSGFAGRKQAKVSNLRFMIIPDPAIADAALLSGDIDILPRMQLHLVREFERYPEIHTVAAEQLYWNVLLIQSNDPMLRDINMRRAIAHAISIEQVAAITSFNRATSNPSAVPTVSRFHNQNHQQGYAYDPDLARQFLRKAGYAGQPVKLQTNRKYVFMFDAAIAIQAMLVDSGINARLEVLDWATQLSNYYEGKFQLATFGYSGRTHPAINYSTILGDKDNNPAYQWQNEEALNLLQRADRSLSEDLQTQLFNRVHELMIADVPILGLSNELEVDAVRSRVSGYRPWSIGRPRLWGVSLKAADH